jgi:hypothetical protein
MIPRMTPGEALEAIKRYRDDYGTTSEVEEAIRTLEVYRSPDADAEALAACVLSLIDLECAMHGTADKIIGRLLTQFGLYAGRGDVTLPTSLKAKETP